MKLLARFKAWLATLRREREPEPVWTVDRDGRVRQPERRVVLRAKPQPKP